MRQVVLAVFLIASSAPAAGLRAQEQNPAASDIPEFVARYQESLERVDAAFSDLASENLPLRDDEGKPLARRPLEDRRQALADLRDTSSRLAQNPQDLVLATTLFVRSEALADDLFDLAQLAYDNDREELAKRLTDLLGVMDHDKDLLQSFALSLAEKKEERIHQLEKENQELKDRLKEATPPGKPKPSRVR